MAYHLDLVTSSCKNDGSHNHYYLNKINNVVWVRFDQKDPRIKLLIYANGESKMVAITKQIKTTVSRGRTYVTTTC